MTFSDILGYESIKRYLTESVAAQRIPHAQLFVGNEGCGTLPNGYCLCITYFMS